MKLALVNTSTKTIVTTYRDLPRVILLPSGDRVEGAQAGWSSGDFALTQVAEFVPPAGQVEVGAARYIVGDDGSVTEIYDTVAAPVVTQVSGDVFMARVTDQEMTAIEAAAAQNVQMTRWLELLRLKGYVDVASDEARAAKAGLVTAGLLTQDRADAIFAAT